MNKHFLVKWERGDAPKSVFKLKKETNKPFTWRERDYLAKTMSVTEVCNTSEYAEHSDIRRNRKWKEVRHLVNITNRPEYNKGSLENALWFYGHHGITVNHFVMAVINEFQFDASLDMDTHLRWLYWSFDGGRDDNADWREILVCFKIIIFFRLVQTKTAELLLIIFDIFAWGDDGTLQ